MHSLRLVRRRTESPGLEIDDGGHWSHDLARRLPSSDATAHPSTTLTSGDHVSTSLEQAEYLRIYLQDHLAAATAGSQRATRLADAEAESVDSAALAGFAADVAADLDALSKLMDTLSVERSWLKTSVAVVREKLGTLKLNGRVTERSPLSTVIELEAIQMAVRGKRSLWETLQAAMPSASPIDFGGLILRADEQLETLSLLHAARVPSTFAVPAVES